MPCGGEIGLSIVILLLDDARYDQLDRLPLTDQRLADHAVVFDRAYVTVPMCCPERASFLSGGWLPQWTGVLTNEAPRGGATVFPDGDTLATRLQTGGYATALNGKYLNDYDKLGDYVPPGWTSWAAVAEGDPWTDFTVTSGSSGSDAPAEGEPLEVAGYVSDWQGEWSSSFILDHAADPFFLYLSLRAPHDPHEPFAGDVGSAAGYRYRGGAFEEEDVSDKPSWIQQIPLMTAEEEAAFDAQVEERVETLPAVDRALAAVVDTLRATGRLNDTLIVVTSDNGLQYREHRLEDKGVGYEESVHVPLVLYNPAFNPRHTDALVATNLDLAATVTDLAGLPATGQGRSLRAIACDETDQGRDEVLLQAWPYDQPEWAGLVTPEVKYIESGTGDVELYDLSADPTEAENVAAASVNADIVSELSASLAAQRGLAITSGDLPALRVGQAWSEQLTAWGGEGTLRWSLTGGELPAGISLSESGKLSGTPTAEGTVQASIGVVDESVSPLTGGPQGDQRSFALVVGPARPAATPAPGCDCNSASGLGGMGLPVLWMARRRAKMRREPDPPA